MQDFNSLSTMLFQKNCDISAEKRTELIKGYEEKFNNPYFAATLGAIEKIIAPHDTRKRIIALLEALQYKKEARLTKKHNNIPL